MGLDCKDVLLTKGKIILYVDVRFLPFKCRYSRVLCCCSLALFTLLESFYGLKGMDIVHKHTMKVNQKTVAKSDFHPSLLTMKIIL